MPRAYGLHVFSSILQVEAASVFMDLEDTCRSFDSSIIREKMAEVTQVLGLQMAGAELTAVKESIPPEAPQLS